VIAALVPLGNTQNLGDRQEGDTRRADGFAGVDETMKHAVARVLGYLRYDHTDIPTNLVQNSPFRPHCICSVFGLSGPGSVSIRESKNVTTPTFPDWHGTTILVVRKNGRTVIAGDGQVSMGATIVKGATC
jgi:hypothetical protein